MNNKPDPTKWPYGVPISGTKGESGTSLYERWRKMISRCYNKSCSEYPRYGGREILIDKDWLNFQQFKIWSDLNGYDSKLVLDRRDNDGHYEPNNCRWVSKTISNRNRNKQLTIKSSSFSQKYIGIRRIWWSNQYYWISTLQINGTQVRLGFHKTQIAAATARDQYILDHNLQGYKLNDLIRNNRGELRTVN